MGSSRNISVDLLKICSMLMVVALHVTSHGVKNAQIIPFEAPYWFVTIVNSFSLVAVNCFVLISGYFLSGGKVKYGRIIPLWVQVCTYSVGVYLLLCLLPGMGVTFSIRGLLEYFMPLMTNQYWFFKYYVLIVLLAPFLNDYIASIDKARYEKMLLMCMILFSIIPSVNVFGDTFGAASGYSLIWFVVLYLIAGYLRKYPVSKGPWLRIYLCCSVVTILIRLCGSVPCVPLTWFVNLQANYNSPLVVAASISLFLAALHGKASYGTFADAVIWKSSGLSFAVYLLHDHGSLSDLLWNKWINLPGYMSSGTAFLYRGLGALAVIFGSGILVEFVLSEIYRLFSKKVKYAKKHFEGKGEIRKLLEFFEK